MTIEEIKDTQAKNDISLSLEKVECVNMPDSSLSGNDCQATRLLE